MKEKKLHNIVIGVDLAKGSDSTIYTCNTCKYITKNKEELKEKECGGLPPLGFGVGDKAPSRDKFGG